jgi:hypothetical protein
MNAAFAEARRVCFLALQRLHRDQEARPTWRPTATSPTAAWRQRGLWVRGVGQPGRRRPSSVSSRRSHAAGPCPIRSRGDPRGSARPTPPSLAGKIAGHARPESMILPSIRGWSRCAATRASSRSSAGWGFHVPRLPRLPAPETISFRFTRHGEERLL